MANNTLTIDGYFQVIASKERKIEIRFFLSEINNHSLHMLEKIISDYHENGSALKNIKEYIDKAMKYAKEETYGKLEFLSAFCTSLIDAIPKNPNSSTSNEATSLIEEIHELHNTCSDLSNRVEMIVSGSLTSDISNAAVSKARNALNEIEEKRNEILAKEEKLENDMNNYLTVSISAVGIFVAVVAVFFGGYTTLSSIVTEAGIRDCLYFTSLFVVGMIIFNTVFLLAYLLSKIIGKPISTTCKKYDKKTGALASSREDHCLNCEEKCGFWRKLVRKYHYLLWANVIFLSIIFILRIETARNAIFYIIRLLTNK